MSRLPTSTLSFDRKKQNWKLQDDTSDRVLRRFDKKADATAGGVLKDVLGTKGGSIRIEKKAGGYEEERTFPAGKDPRKSKG